ncbi:Altronate dehydratase [termite gut metagenome]|uniref:Altronate dehydratase n=1 Tax=termite gut metagenome TaxID=433724 RepID=A0A5J4RPN1_9ZZZZ
MKEYIQLHSKDNVVVALKDLKAGETIDFNGLKILLINDISFGHKAAVRNIPAGDKVLKYGLPIGSATRHILAGEHVHIQNLQTDYTLNHDRILQE